VSTSGASSDGLLVFGTTAAVEETAELSDVLVSCETLSEAVVGSAQEPEVTGQKPPVLVAPLSSSSNSNSKPARWSVATTDFDRSNCRFDPVKMQQLLQKCDVSITLDACAADAAHALADSWCSMSADRFLSYDCSKQQVWLDPPIGKARKYLQHYLECKQKAPADTSAIILVPKSKQLRPLLQGMTLIKSYSRGTRIYNAVSGTLPQPGVPYAIQAYYDAPAKLAAGRFAHTANSQEPAVTLQSLDNSSLLFQGELSGAKARLHVDSGATHSCVAAHFVERAGLAVTPVARTVALADGQLARVLGVCKARIRVGDIKDVHTFYVLKLDTTYDVLLGQDWLRRKKAVLDFGRQSMTITVRDGLNRTVTSGDGAFTPGGGEMLDGRISALQMKRLARKPDTELFLVVVNKVPDQTVEPDARCASAAFEGGNECLIPQGRLQKILDRYKSVFADIPAGTIHRKGLPEMTIDFENGKQPPVGYQYRLSQPEKEELQRQLTLALEKGWVEPSSSPFGAPVLFARKKGGGLRWCIDYRACNTITIKNRYPLPRIDDLLDQLNGAACFTGLDLAAGYWQIPIREEDRFKTAFRTPYGLYQWKVMPFGLTNAPAVFARTMQQVFSDMIGKFVLVYLDDILIYSKTPEEHEKHLALVLARLEENKFYAQLHKCHFALPEVEFLGHMVSEKGIKVDPRKVKIVQEWPVPKNVSEVRSFLGLANYFRRFVHAYSTIARPLHALTAKDASWQWTSECQSAFQLLKDKLTAAPVLAAPDFSKPFEVVADASDFTLGAILLQEGRPVAFESRKLTPAECNYITGEKELLAVMHALNIWRCYLDGSKFTIFSDHEPLSYLRTKATLLPRQVRWSQFLERFDYIWEYRPGRINAADPLSRVSHAVETGSGTGSLTGKGPASETVLDYLAVVSTRSQKKAAELPAVQPRKKRRLTANKTSTTVDDELPVPAPAVTADRQQVAADLRDALIAAYKAADDKFTAVVTRYSLRQEDNLWWHGPQLYVPTAALRQRCIVEAHDTPYSGHKGVTKTLAAVQRLYWWPGMRAAVNNYVTTCASCQRNKAPGKKPIGLLKPLEVPAAPWAEVTMDFITGLPCTAAGHDAVMVFCDRLSKMVHFAACTTTVDAAGAAKLFKNHVFAAHGLPVSIVSDRDTRFKSEFWSALVELLGVKHKMSSAFHPQTDGQTERVNRVLEEYLRHYVNPSHDDWDEWLPLAEFAYNNSVHEATGETPFFLNYGVHPRLPGAVRTQAKSVPAAAEFAERLTQIIDKAKERLEAARQRAMRIANPGRRDAVFSVGDSVLLSSRNISMKTPGSNKLLPKYLGPFKVTEVLSPVTYRLELPASMKCHNVFHVGLLLEYKTDGRDQPPPPALEFDDGEGGQWFEIDRVLSHRESRVGRRRVVMQYLVKWKGYGDEYNEWRDEPGVTASATAEYWSRVGGRGAAPPHLHKKTRRGIRSGKKKQQKRARRAADA
jgi:hypothetical protein